MTEQRDDRTGGLSELRGDAEDRIARAREEHERRLAEFLEDQLRDFEHRAEQVQRTIEATCDALGRARADASEGLEQAARASRTTVEGAVRRLEAVNASLEAKRREQSRDFDEVLDRELARLEELVAALKAERTHWRRRSGDLEASASRNLKPLVILAVTVLLITVVAAGSLLYYRRDPPSEPPPGPRTASEPAPPARSVSPEATLESLERRLSGDGSIDLALAAVETIGAGRFDEHLYAFYLRRLIDVASGPRERLEVMLLQSALLDSGHPLGVDGAWGPATCSAVAAAAVAADSAGRCGGFAGAPPVETPGGSRVDCGPRPTPRARCVLLTLLPDATTGRPFPRTGDDLDAAIRHLLGTPAAAALLQRHASSPGAARDWIDPSRIADGGSPAWHSPLTRDEARRLVGVIAGHLGYRTEADLLSADQLQEVADFLDAREPR